MIKTQRSDPASARAKRPTSTRKEKDAFFFFFTSPGKPARISGTGVGIRNNKETGGRLEDIPARLHSRTFSLSLFNDACNPEIAERCAALRQRNSVCRCSG